MNFKILLLCIYYKRYGVKVEYTSTQTSCKICSSIFILQLLEQGMVIAEGVKDYHYADFVTSVFLAEQIKSIHEISNHVTQLTALGNNQHALYHYDWKLSKMYPYSIKI